MLQDGEAIGFDEHGSISGFRPKAEIAFPLPFILHKIDGKIGLRTGFINNAREGQQGNEKKCKRFFHQKEGWIQFFRKNQQMTDFQFTRLWLLRMNFSLQTEAAKKDHGG